MRKLLLLVAALFAFAVSAKADMTVNYSYDHGGNFSGGQAYFFFIVNVQGDTTCTMGCILPKPTHQPIALTNIGTLNQTDYGNALPYDDEINFTNQPYLITVPFTSKLSNLHAWVQCSQLGTISYDSNAYDGVYFSTATTFVLGSGNGTAHSDCTYTNDTHPIWAGGSTNPYGRAYSGVIEEIAVMYATHPAPTNVFYWYPNVLDSHPYMYLSSKWIFPGGGQAPMPQQCTQLGVGYQQINPGWVPLP